MSAFDNEEKDNLEYEIRTFLETHTINDLLIIVNYCIDSKENGYIDKIDKLKG